MAYNKIKCDAELGLRVQKYLKSKKLHTPMVDSTLTEQEKIDSIKPLMRTVLEVLGLDLNDDSLQDTPHRIAKMFVREIFWGLDPEAFPKCTTVDNKMTRGKEFVLEKNVSVSSTCEHHFLPIMGGCCVAYIPGDKVLGLSKMNRVVEYFSKRPQVQERLTSQIREALSFILDTDDVIVYIDASHTCVSTRGVEDTGSSTVTLSGGGVFNDEISPARSEFLAIARSGMKLNW